MCSETAEEEGEEEQDAEVRLAGRRTGRWCIRPTQGPQGLPRPLFQQFQLQLELWFRGRVNYA